MLKSNPFKWRHYEPEIILLCVRWYLTYPLSYRQVAEMVNERGLDVHHTTVFRWVQQYAPELDKRCRPHLKLTNDSWRVDETYIKVKGKDKYLYRAVDSDGNTLDFLLTAKRDAEAAKRFFRKTLNAVHTQEPRVINVDKNAAYPKAIDELKDKEELFEQVELRQNKYLNNIVEQDHRGIKRLVKPGMGFASFNTARRTIKGYEIMNMLRKGQIQAVAKGAVQKRVKFINQIFGVAA
ncbi:MAG: IS6 family transposase ISAcma1 [Chroococcidiopsis cubana SAG 39.79]|uniref:IS6 family transposase n=1 Tax=Chroococcidiopsis cubana SAG 39.79 TaxID=388085 RepID=A0AB37U9K3_9CYAN|nr:IS6 family transposase [Chroococcidiopsis cubana]MDZ4876898.1 IS6 family transposase ISAcma1 [Chroococcidiopsis cubana SAG 39.79]PSB60171.1 IS6 family transposase [Chroococcidiopsis cubana CCALA 043]RUS97069.1 IS6 family transposase [Chroococcidiopsis cubana SAG 39.79]